METEKNYYTPNKKEFRIGFQYEFRNVNGDWQKEILEDIEFDTISDMITMKTVRVKYLDVEDLKELGFVLDHDSNISVEGYFKHKNYKTNKPIGYLFPNEVCIYYDFTSKRLSMGTCADGLFDGIIKNKSELKVLMKQLNIE